MIAIHFHLLTPYQPYAFPLYFTENKNAFFNAFSFKDMLSKFMNLISSERKECQPNQQQLRNSVGLSISIMILMLAQGPRTNLIKQTTKIT